MKRIAIALACLFPAAMGTALARDPWATQTAELVTRTNGISYAWASNARHDISNAALETILNSITAANAWPDIDLSGVHHPAYDARARRRTARPSPPSSAAGSCAPAGYSWRQLDVPLSGARKFVRLEFKVR